MGFWIYMFFVSMIVPLTMIGFGKLFMRKAPGNINYFFGYRTRRSMMNMTTWNFAHFYCGKLWLRMGLGSLPASMFIMLLMIGRDEDTVGKAGGIIVGAHIILLILTVILTERKLKKKFDEYGRSRG